MIEVDDTRLSYYERCIERARLAAETATSEQTRVIHLELMRRYEQKLANIRHLPQPGGSTVCADPDQVI